MRRSAESTLGNSLEYILINYLYQKQRIADIILYYYTDHIIDLLSFTLQFC